MTSTQQIKTAAASSAVFYADMDIRMRDDLINESLFFGLGHARSAIAEWADDYDNFRLNSSLGYQSPADHAGIIAATGSNAAKCTSFAFPTVAPIAPFGLSKTAEALIVAG